MNRTQIIQRLIVQNNYKSYLEIGLGNGKNFSVIEIDHKVGVDPVLPKTAAPEYWNFCEMTSNDFFNFCYEKFDIIFIDGLHLKEQYIEDVENSLLHLNSGGVIVTHDCMPYSEAEQTRTINVGGGWTGDVWKGFAHLRATREDLSMFVLPWDHGIGIIRPGKQELYKGPYETYKDYEINKLEMMQFKTDGF